MINSKELAHFRTRLLDRRQEIFDLRLRHSDSWQQLRERTAELEEQAAREHMAQSFEFLDDQEKNEIEAIDIALRKIEIEHYGACESCGKSIARKRLEAIPWTPLCINCVARAEGRNVEFTGGSNVSGAATRTMDYAGMSDEEIEEAVIDEIRQDGRIDLTDLEVSCQNGVVYLNGSLPSDTQHLILFELLEDAMDLPDIVDNLKIERYPREPGEEEEGEEVEETEEPVEELDFEKKPSGEETFEPVDTGPLDEEKEEK